MVQRQERKQSFSKFFPFVSYQDEQTLKKYINDDNPAELQQIMQKRQSIDLQYHEEAINDQWERYGTHEQSKPFELTSAEICEEMLRIRYFTCDWAGKINIDLYETGRSRIILCPNNKNTHTYSIKRGLEKFEKNLPANYMTHKLCIFLNLLKKPKQSEKKFKITLDNKKISIDKNTLPDLAIACSYLHYVDKFITLDKGQYDILTILFPKYAHKVELKAKPKGHSSNT